jgi:calcineurin-like phosphoesterase family protein
MIERWNERPVRNPDIVYHLGDFAFADQTPYLSRLNGQKHLIIGNHDHSNRINTGDHADDHRVPAHRPGAE